MGQIAAVNADNLNRLARQRRWWPQYQLAQQQLEYLNTHQQAQLQNQQQMAQMIFGALNSASFGRGRL